MPEILQVPFFQMENPTDFRFSRLLNLPEFDDIYTWLPTDENKNPSVFPSNILSPSNFRTPSTSGTIIDNHSVDISSHLSEKIPDSSESPDNYSPTSPDISTLPSLEEVPFRIFKPEDMRKSPQSMDVISTNRLTRSISSPSQFKISHLDNLTNIHEEPPTVSFSNRKPRSNGTKYSGEETIQRRFSERRYMTSGEIIPLPTNHPVIVQDFVASLQESEAVHPITSESPIDFPPFPEYPPKCTESQIVMEVHRSNSVGDSQSKRITPPASSKTPSIQLPDGSQPNDEPAQTSYSSLSTSPMPLSRDFSNLQEVKKISPDIKSDISSDISPPDSPRENAATLSDHREELKLG